MGAGADSFRRVHDAIAASDRSFRARFRWLAHQDAIGLGVWVAALTATVAFGVGYASGVLPAWATILSVALSVSLLHELEHDLIHNLYFRSRPWVQHAMFAGIWLAKGSLNPWTRRGIHLRHHRVSGQPDDVEERLIGLGHPSFALRLLTSFLPMFTVVAYGRSLLRDAPDWRPLRRPGDPLRWLGPVDALFGLSPLLLGLLTLAGSDAARVLLVAWCFPNLLRHGSLALLSSYSHYYGDVPAHDIPAQNQVLRHWALWPLQLFAFGFGATHIIHHYYVQQPFYLRHLVRHDAWRALAAEGARFDDLGIVRRANRRGSP